MALEILAHLARHRVRTGLTAAGLVAGVLVLVLVGSLTETLHRAFSLQEQSTLGTIQVYPTSWQHRFSSATRQAIRRVPGVLGTLCTLWGQLRDREEGPGSSPEFLSEYLWAVDSDIPGLEYGPPLIQTELFQGRLPLPGATNEIVIDFDLASDRSWEVGEMVVIRDRPFVVTGILERPSFGGSRSAYLDYHALRALLRSPRDEVQYVDVVPEPGQDPEELAARIEELVPHTHAETAARQAQRSRSELLGLGAVAGVSGGLALLAGTLTVINTMLMSVQERRSEIGLKKALGASDGDVVREFLLEAATLGVLGGGTGVLLAWFAALGANAFTRAQWGLNLLSVTPRLALAAITLSTFLGAAAGVYPSWRAARQNPVQALRDAAPELPARPGLQRVLSLAARRARWLLTVGGISAGIFLLAEALSVAEFMNGYIEAAVAATADRVGLNPQHPNALYTTAVRELERMDGVRGVVLMAGGGPLKEESVPTSDLLRRRPLLFGLDSPTGEFGLSVPNRARIARGRFLAPGSLREAVIGGDLARSLGLGVGAELDVRGRGFTVVGIWEDVPEDLVSGYGLNAYVSMAALRVINGAQPVHPEVTALVAAGVDPEALAARISDEMPEWRVTTGARMAGELRRAMLIFSLALGAYVSLGLMAGGLSVMNTLLMAVAARTREIGLKKAIGASDGDILAEVVEESGWVGLLGGTIGIVAGWLVALGVNAFTRHTSGVALMVFTPRLMVAALVFTASLGMIAGLYPAWRASRLDPVRALRSE